MARVVLTRYEVDGNRLPAVCIRCGRPSDLTLERRFSWHPPWIDTLIVLGLILFTPLVIVGIVLAATQTKRMYVEVPLCTRHRNHWRWRAWFVYGGLVAVILLAAGTIAFLVVASDRPNADLQYFAAWTCGGAGVVGVVWLIAAALIEKGTIRASEITDETIALSRVSPDFKSAAQAERDPWEDPSSKRGPDPRRRHHPEDAERIRPPDEPDDRDLPPGAYREAPE